MKSYRIIWPSWSFIVFETPRSWLFWLKPTAVVLLVSKRSHSLFQYYIFFTVLQIVYGIDSNVHRIIHKVSLGIRQFGTQSMKNKMHSWLMLPCACWRLLTEIDKNSANHISRPSVDGLIKTPSCFLLFSPAPPPPPSLHFFHRASNMAARSIAVRPLLAIPLKSSRYAGYLVENQSYANRDGHIWCHRPSSAQVLSKMAEMKLILLKSDVSSRRNKIANN